MNKTAKILFKSDIERYGNSGGYAKRFHKWFRKSQNCNNRFLEIYYRFRFKRLKDKRGIEIYAKTKIGKGLYLGHAYNITINPFCRYR